MMALRGLEIFVTLVGVCIVVIDAFPITRLLQQNKHPNKQSIHNKNHPNQIISGKNINKCVLYSSTLVADIKKNVVLKPKKTVRPKFDRAFLRKRTANLLHITSPEYLASDEHLTTPDSTKLTKKWKKADRRTFHWLIDSWAFSGQREGVDHALNLLFRMESIASSHPHLAPDVRSYSKLINAYSKSGRRDAGDKAHSILISMLELQSSSNNTVIPIPNSFLYTSVLEAYAKASPKSPTAAQKAETLCYEMHSLYKNRPELNISPTARSYNAVINAWGRSSSHVPDSAQRAEAFLDAMERAHAEDANNPKPNTINYNSAIHAWANSQSDDAPNHSQRLLQKMRARHFDQNDEHVKPNEISYNACIDAWAKSGAQFAGRRAEQVLVTMQEGAGVEEDGVKPNTRSYNAVMNAYAKSRDDDAVYSAQRCLERMEREYNEGNEDVKPDFISFATVINAWGRSWERGKAEHVLKIFNDMEKLFNEGNTSVRPNVVIFNAVINACAYTFGDQAEKNRAIEISHHMFTKLEKSNYGKPDQVTYGTFLKVCNTQMPPDNTRDRVVTAIIRKCMKDGQVGKLVLDELTTAVSEDLFEDLMGKNINECKTVDDLPKYWRRNVVKKYRRKYHR